MALFMFPMALGNWFMSLAFKAIRRPYSLLKMVDWPRASSCARWDLRSRYWSLVKVVRRSRRS
jgi:hypothetical protein